VRVGVANDNHQFGAWLLQAHDQIRLVGVPDEAAPSPTTVPIEIPHVAAGGQSWVSYRLHPTRRGRYEFGPLTVSTRFPLGLLKGLKVAHHANTLLVTPRLGRLLPEWTRQLQGEAGHQQQQSRARQGLAEGEFHGLREWRSGDTRRWIHWRTSARLGTLAVRQFEQQRQSGLALLLDLWLPSRPTPDQRLRVELAISFAATALQELGRHGGSRLVFALAGREAGCWAAPTSPAFADELLEQLAVAEGGEATLSTAAEKLLSQWTGGTPSMVISTRNDQLRRLDRELAGDADLQRRLHRMQWLDVGSDQLPRFFRLEET
jgi:uncharacterized protein (DUF58 family)